MNSERGQQAEDGPPVSSEAIALGSPADGAISSGVQHLEMAGAAVEIEALADGVRFIIPPPGMGTWKRSGWMWLLAGNMLVIAGAVGGAIGQHLAAGVGHMVLNLSIWAGAGAIILIGLLFVDSGLSYLFGRRMIDVRGRRVSITRQSGLVRLRRRVPLVRIRRLRVMLAVDSGDADVEKLTATLTHSMHYAICAELESGGKRKLVQWLSYDFAREFAEVLALAIERHYLAHGVAVDPPAVHIDAKAVERAADDDVDRTLPEGSDIEVKEDDGELSIIVPKIPLLRGKGGQSVAGMLFSTLGAAAIGVIIFSGFSWFWLIFLVPAGLAWGKFVVERIGGRETYIDVVNGTLLISHASFRGVKQYQWLRHKIKSIRRGKSDLEINDTHLPQLEVVAISGELPEDTATKKHGFLIGRSEEEINWIAWRLRRALGVPVSAQDDEGEDDEAEPEADEGDEDSWF